MTNIDAIKQAEAIMRKAMREEFVGDNAGFSRCARTVTTMRLLDRQHQDVVDPPKRKEPQNTPAMRSRGDGPQRMR